MIRLGIVVLIVTSCASQGEKKSDPDCRREVRTGSHIARIHCRTEEQRLQEERDGQEFYERIQRKPIDKI